MGNHQLNVLFNFSVREIFLLYWGKLIPSQRSPAFHSLQDKQNKLSLLSGRTKFSLVGKEEVYVSFSLEKKEFKSYLRLRGSDVFVFNQVIILEEYKYVLAVFSDNFKSVPLTIVDAGANIGLTTLFFKSANQDVRVISIEPDPQNHAQASKNFQENLLQSVHLQQLALWPKSERLNIVNDFRDKQEWSLRVEVSDHGLIKTITPLEAILFLGETVDIFKMDIEGGEFEIFNIENDLSWLNRIKVIALEIHEEYGAAEKINAVLTNYGFTLHYHGELTVGINSAFLKINQK